MVEYCSSTSPCGPGESGDERGAARRSDGILDSMYAVSGDSATRGVTGWTINDLLDELQVHHDVGQFRVIR